MTTSSRRNFLSIAATGSALAASGVLAGETLAAPADTFPSGGGRYVPPVKFGLGGVPLGNEFELVSDEDAYKTLKAAWNAGVRYYDVSPWYGLGLAERRYGNFLHNKNRDDYVLSSKVGKLLKASPYNDATSNFPFSPSPNNVVFDYTADGVRRSIEDSLQRMGVSRLDIAFVHDISSDNKLLPTSWQEQDLGPLRGRHDRPRDRPTLHVRVNKRGSCRHIAASACARRPSAAWLGPSGETGCRGVRQAHE